MEGAYVVVTNPQWRIQGISQKDGEWIYYDETGAVIKREFYEKGKLKE